MTTHTSDLLTFPAPRVPHFTRDPEINLIAEYEDQKHLVERNFSLQQRTTRTAKIRFSDAITQSVITHFKYRKIRNQHLINVQFYQDTQINIINNHCGVNKPGTGSYSPDGTETISGELAVTVVQTID